MSEDAILYKVATAPVRNDSVYIPWQIRRALTMIARAKEMPADALASDVLRDWLTAQHPEVVAHIEAQQTAGNEFEKQLKAKLCPPHS